MSQDNETTQNADRKASILRTNMRLTVIEGLVAMPIVFMTLPGNYLVASLATDALRLDKALYGVIVSMAAWSNVAQLFLLPWISRFYSQKKICLSFSWIHALSWLGLAAALPQLAEGGAWRSGWLIVLVFAFAVGSFSMVSVSWTSWVQEWLPTKARGKYLGRRNRLLQISSVLFLLLVGQSFAYFEGNLIYAFQSVITVSVALRIASIVYQQRILATRPEPEPPTESAFAQIAKLVKNRPLMLFIGFGAAFGLTANFMGPFFPIFFYETLHMDVNELSRVVMTATITGAFSMPIWGEMCDKYGCRPVVAIALIFWMLFGYLYLLATPSTVWVIYLIYALGGVTAAGYLFGSFNMLLKLIPPESKTTAISLNIAASSLAAAIAPIIGGFLKEWSEAAFEDQLQVFHVASVIHHTLILSTALILLKIPEPRSTTMLQAIGAMRPLRYAGAALGLSFLGNYSFFRKAKRDD